ncbi:hypothetical protein K7432_013740 [Basidiobolus ranarum]|uniref:Uncharacterized protein n=1 Tax=Basidiobolus ranarum TaxID=34480 RepID=A0ABR2VQE2_9FUNG
MKSLGGEQREWSGFRKISHLKVDASYQLEFLTYFKVFRKTKEYYVKTLSTRKV